MEKPQETISEIPLPMLIDAWEYLDDKKLLSGFKAGPYSENHEALSFHLWETKNHKQSFRMEVLIFRILEKIATHGVVAWNQNPVVDRPKFFLNVAPTCRWAKNLDHTCGEFSRVLHVTQEEVKAFFQTPL